MNLAEFLRDVPDFPKPGILFKDISPLLGNPAAMRFAIDSMVDQARDLKIDHIAGIESRGFLFGMPLALRLDVGFTAIRKPGKLPAATQEIEYDLEYGSDRLEIHVDAFRPGESVLLVDDVLATGGTAAASCQLIEMIGGKVAGCSFLLELDFLKGRERLPDRPVMSVIKSS